MVESPFNEVAELRNWNFIQKKLQHKCFPDNFAKVLKTGFLIEHP